MYKILLCCTSGLTTSMLVNAMKKVANERSLDVMIWNVAASAIGLSWADADCILIGPQNIGELEKVKLVVKTSIPVSIINETDFLKMDGEAVLDLAIKLIEK